MAGRQKKIINKPVARNKSRRAKHTGKTSSASATVKTSRSKNVKSPSFIVGIGASAGGLEAIEEFFSCMPSVSGLSFIVIQHLPSSHKSVLDSLIKKYTKIKPLQIKDGMKIEPDCIYFGPSHCDVAVMDNALYLMEHSEGQGTRSPINFFFHSLAESHGENAICIILSGTGTDGTSGLKAIKDAGGMVMAQDIRQARFSGMPESAISTGLVDYILPIEMMPATLTEYVKHFHAIKEKNFIADQVEFDAYLQKILMLIRSKTGHNFYGYKKQSIRRRIERRMAIHQIGKIKNYFSYLEQNPFEIHSLFKDLIIRITSFFRDSEAFEILKWEIINDILKNREPGSTVRAWIAGCSTGEEAYTLAIIFSEAMAELKKHYNIQIFATDIDEDAITYARTGVYPLSIATDVSADRLSNFFAKTKNAYKINNMLREMIVFAVHSLVKDPPFSRLDFISCRNLLIYMDGELQQKILFNFHYSLRQGGILFLGGSETPRKFTDLFIPVDKRWSLYKHKSAASYYPAASSSAPMKDLQEQGENAEVKTEKKSLDIEWLIEKKLVDKYVPVCVVINKSREVVYFKGDISRYLKFPSGKASYNILKMAGEDLRHDLRAMIYKAAKEKKQIVHTNLRIRVNRGLEEIDLIVEPISWTESLQDHIAVCFKDARKTVKTPFVKTKDASTKKKTPPPDFKDRLRFMEENFEIITEELENCNKDLIFKTEEMRGVNEELQSANEELQTSREELQSTNEELLSVNAQLHEKIDELTWSNNDLNNLFSSTEIGTIFLDVNLCIRRFTPSVTRLFCLQETDIGRPLQHYSTTILYDELIKNVNDVLNSLQVKEIEVQSKDGEWYIMRIIPYRTAESVVDGVIITFVNISKMKKAEIAINKAHEFSTNVLNSINDAISIIDVNDFRIIDCNDAFLKSLNIVKEDVLGRTCHEVTHHCKDPGSCRPPEHLCPISGIMESGKHTVTEHTHYNKDGQKIYVEVSASPIKNEKGEIIQVVHVARDITDRKQKEEGFKKSIEGLKKQLDELKMKKR